MCTVTFIPTGPQSFILTSNRDENPQRTTGSPDANCTIIQEECVVFPRDQRAGGTWIAISSQNRMACLLNGAFVKHQHRPPYRKSRGLIVLDFFSATGIRSFTENIDLDGIEPFTLVMIDKGELGELRWDGSRKHFRALDPSEAWIWSSATLYDEETAAAKEVRFRRWLSTHPGPSPQDVSHFHGVNNPEGYLLDLPVVKTVSITSVENTGSELRMVYHDLLTGVHSAQTVEILNQL